MQTAPEWRVLGHSVRGAAHHRSGLPNQDAIHWLPATRVGPPLILAISDGHGSAKNFRSDVGSDLAVRQTAWLIQDLVDGQPDPANLSAIKRTAEERLPQEIARQWQEAVAGHHRKNPFTPAELRALEEKKGVEARRQIEATPRLAYGATILCVLVTADFILYLQLGDGDILTVSAAGEVQRPLPRDARLFANETTSLCTEDAWRDVRFRFEALFNAPPALIMLATDGYANSFVNDTAFFKVGSDLLAILREDGAQAIEANLPTWLSEASEAGSGDDITVGLLYRAPPPPPPPSDVDEAADEDETTSAAPPETEIEATIATSTTPPPAEPEPATPEAPPPSSQSPAPRRPKINPKEKATGPREPCKSLDELLSDARS
ncbi:MAG: PP2C family serine/threonine-protein phosphatase, partial [Anaerolineales bacterium]